MFNWQRNLYASWAAQMLALVGFSATLPFLPLYLQDLGVPSKEDAAFITGVMSTASFLALAFMSPVWGMLSDQYGRKSMVFRSMFAGFLLMGLMGLTNEVWQVVILRILQGAFTGSIAASIAFVASIVPQNKMGYALGLMQTAVFAGLSVGPLLGGLVGDIFGHRYIFLVTAILLLIASLIVFFIVQEEFQPPEITEKVSFSKALFGDIGAAFRTPGVMAMALVLAFIQLSNVLIFPVLPIFVQQLGSLSPDIGISTTLGLVSAIAGLASAISSVLTGRLSDKYGQLVIIVSLAIGAAIFNVLQAFCTDSFQLLITRCLAGFFLGGIMPAANAVIGQVTPRGKRGSAYGFVNMIGSLGLSLGPISGATLAVIINPQAAFLATAVLLLGIALWVGSGPPRQVLAGLRTGQAPARLEEQPAPSQE